MYELRTNDNPDAMPTGTATISKHRTYEAAVRARDAEAERYARSIYGQTGGYLQRVIVEIDGAGRARVCE